LNTIGAIGYGGMQGTNPPDVIVLGGGLAGLTLALQLRQRFEGIEVLVLERREHPVPEAAHKVGESSVEIAANYFDTVLGLKQHLMDRQLKKFGFRFFFNERRMDLDRTTELGASRYLAAPSYQLDRGIFENHLGELARERGIRFLDGARVERLALDHGDAPHEVEYELAGARHVAQARWVVDASGRTGLIKRQLGLAQDNDHDANAVWFRIADRIDVHDWSGDAQWKVRCDPPSRWLSTIHLCGEGYWVWLIPLSSGSHSIGIVCDAKRHPLERMSTFERAMEWLREFQPQLHAQLDRRRHLLQDFRFLRKFSYGCKQVFSGQRWALTGDAGLFLDPFYSPGSDFIAIANTCIAELIAKDRAGAEFAPYARAYEQVYFSFYESTLALYTDQYPIFGNPEVMPVKVIWDYTYYWGVLAQIWYQRRVTDLNSLSRLRTELAQAKALNFAVQRLLRSWSALGGGRESGAMLDQAALPWFVALNRSLLDPPLDDAGYRARIRANVALLKALALEIAGRARADVPDIDMAEVEALAQGAMAETALLFQLAA
jgi:flavin-dependent dehydrogenase